MELTPLAAVAWAWLLLFRGGFWRARERLEAARAPEPASWPEVVAIVPARNEADVLRRTLASVATQDYPGRLSIVLVDDQSDDGTADAARDVNVGSGKVTVVAGTPRPDGFVPKVWAMAQGDGEARAVAPEARWVWLTDADVEHAPDTLRNLVAKAESENLDQVSLMVELAIHSPAERLLLPAFVLFFQKLYPFAWANDPRRKTAAAAGGCILVSRDALDLAGGFERIRDALIDDCSLAREIKRVAIPRGRGTWLGLTSRSRSVRAYGGLGGVAKMVARSAYTQLGYSPIRLLGTVAGMLILYLLPPVAVLAWPLHRDLTVLLSGILAWGLMTIAFVPTLRLLRRSLLLAPLLPVAGFLYTAMTIGSAWSHVRGRGSVWKGREVATGERAP